MLRTSYSVARYNSLSRMNPQSSIRNPQSERLWRVRKQGASMDARLLESAPGQFELQYLQDGRLVVATRWPSRDAAIADANGRLNDLLRAGWASHW